MLTVFWLTTADRAVCCRVVALCEAVLWIQAELYISSLCPYRLINLGPSCSWGPQPPHFAAQGGCSSSGLIAAAVQADESGGWLMNTMSVRWLITQIWEYNSTGDPCPPSLGTLSLLGINKKDVVDLSKRNRVRVGVCQHTGWLGVPQLEGCAKASLSEMLNL